MPETEHLVRYSLIFFLFSSSILAQEFSNPILHRKTTEGIELIVNQQYDKARILFTKMDKDNPNFPVAKIYLAAIEIASSVDYAEPFDAELIEGALSQTEEICDSALSVDPENLWYNYLAGQAYGCFAYYNSLKGDLLGALASGLSAITYFEKCLEIDSSFYEAQVAIGTYKYWRSVKTKPVEWLPFVEDESREGLKLIVNSLDNLSYNHYLAVYSLIWIYIEEHEFEKAQSLAETTLKKYPLSRFFMWVLASAYSRRDNLKAAKTIERIYKSLSDEKKLNLYNTINIKYKIASEYSKAGYKQKALKLCEELMSINIEDVNTDAPIEERIEKVEKLMEELKLNN